MLVAIATFISTFHMQSSDRCLCEQVTLALGGEGYLNFMGNEFGHPEWIDFPRDDTYDPSTGEFVPGALARHPNPPFNMVRALMTAYSTRRAVHWSCHDLSCYPGLACGRDPAA